jgi:hypothetical protein
MFPDLAELSSTVPYGMNDDATVCEAFCCNSEVPIGEGVFRNQRIHSTRMKIKSGVTYDVRIKVFLWILYTSLNLMLIHCK